MLHGRFWSLSICKESFFCLFFVLTNSNVALSVASGLYLPCNPLRFHSWRRLLIVDFDDTSTCSRVFLIWLDVLWWDFTSPQSTLGCTHTENVWVLEPSKCDLIEWSLRTLKSAGRAQILTQLRFDSSNLKVWNLRKILCV